MLMNLTRMRAFQWESYLPPIMKEYKLHIVWGDQDVINIIFHFHPGKIFSSISAYYILSVLNLCFLHLFSLCHDIYVNVLEDQIKILLVLLSISKFMFYLFRLVLMFFISHCKVSPHSKCKTVHKIPVLKFYAF